MLDRLREQQLYWRPTEKRGERLIDVLSRRGPSKTSPAYGGEMSTEFAISRFLVPHMATSGWALFMDGDVLVRDNLVRLFEQADPQYAVMCVKHVHVPAGDLKMGDQLQTAYKRKNWSSVMLFNCEHAANKNLTLDLVNSVPGADLHQFCWLGDKEIGNLALKWNWLAGYSDPLIDPAVVHHTNGSPCMPGFEHAPYADEWRAELGNWAA